MDRLPTRLAVDIGALTTVAALERGGHRTALAFGDQITLPTPRMDGDVRDLITAVGAARRDTNQPPAQPAAQSRAQPSAEPAVAALIAHLRTVISDVESVDLLLVTTPPTWGRRLHHVLIQAAHDAGLPQMTLISEAAAVATHTLPDAPVDAFVLTSQLGYASSQVTVLQRRRDRWERVATHAVPHATGQRLHRDLAALVLPHTPASAEVATQLSQALQLLAAGMPAAVLVAGQPTPVSLSPNDFQRIAQPLQQSIRDTVAETLDAADIGATQLYAAVVYGDSADLLAPPSDGDELFGVAAMTAPDGRLAAALGALEVEVSTSPTAAATVRAGWGRYGVRLATPIVCAAAAALLVGQLFDIVDRAMPPDVYRLPGDYQVLRIFFDTAAFAVAGWALALTCMATGRNLAAALLADRSRSQARQAGRVYGFSALVGLAVATLQGLLAQAVVGGPADTAPPYLVSAVAGAAVPALVAITVGLTSPWLHLQPAWTERMHFPLTSVVLAVTGILAVNARSHGLPLVGIPHLAGAILGIIGAGLLGVAIALTLVTQPAARLVLGTLLGAACMIIVSYANLHSAIVIYLIVVALWWIRRAARIFVETLPYRRWRSLMPGQHEGGDPDTGGHAVRDHDTGHDAGREDGANPPR